MILDVEKNTPFLMRHKTSVSDSLLLWTIMLADGPSQCETGNILSVEIGFYHYAAS